MQLEYCEQWSRHYSRAHIPLTEHEARDRHQSNQLYTALFGHVNQPTCFLELSAFRSVCVEFLDTLLRTIRVHSFQEKQPNKLFLSAATIRQFDDDSPEPSEAQIYYFEVDGRLTIEHYEVSQRATKLIRSHETAVDVANNWEPYPEFGHYEGLARLDRSVPFLDVRV